MAEGGVIDRPAHGRWIVSGFGLPYAFTAFAVVALAGGVTTLLFAIETKGRVLEELSP